MKLSNLLYILGFASIILSASNYITGKAQDSNKKEAEKERDGLFTGHWAPTFFILGKIAEDREHRSENLLTGGK